MIRQFPFAEIWLLLSNGARTPKYCGTFRMKIAR